MAAYAKLKGMLTPEQFKQLREFWKQDERKEKGGWEERGGPIGRS